MCWWRSWCWEFWFIAFVKASSPWMSAACGGSADDAGSSVGDSAGGVRRLRRGPQARGVGGRQRRRLRPHVSAGSRGGVSSAALRLSDRGISAARFLLPQQLELKISGIPVRPVGIGAGLNWPRRGSWSATRSAPSRPVLCELQPIVGREQLLLRYGTEFQRLELYRRYRKHRREFSSHAETITECHRELHEQPEWISCPEFEQ